MWKREEKKEKALLYKKMPANKCKRKNKFRKNTILQTQYRE